LEDKEERSMIKMNPGKKELIFYQLSFSQQSILVEVLEIFYYLFDAKEKKKIPLGNEILSCPLSHLSQKRES